MIVNSKDGTDTPIVDAHWKAFLTHKRLHSKLPLLHPLTDGQKVVKPSLFSSSVLKMIFSNRFLKNG